MTDQFSPAQQRFYDVYAQRLIEKHAVNNVNDHLALVPSLRTIARRVVIDLAGGAGYVRAASVRYTCKALGIKCTRDGLRAALSESGK